MLTRNLSSFLRIPSARYLSQQESSNNVLNRVTIIGSGHMGTGIAQVSAVAGNYVTVADIHEEALSKSKATIEERLIRLGKKMENAGADTATLTSQFQTIMGRINFTTSIEKSVENCDLVVEAIVEQLEIKHSLFEKIDKVAPPSAIFVTNTSSIPVNEIAAHVTPSRKEKFGGVHFFNAILMKLVEVIRIPETSNESFTSIMNWSKYIGKVPVACKDTPGFIVNRLNIPYFMEALAMVERGDATPKDIDIAMKLGAGYPYGPFEIGDSVGIDVIWFIMQGWQKRFPENPLFRCPDTIDKMYKEGKFGVKTGEGFFKYTK